MNEKLAICLFVVLIAVVLLPGEVEAQYLNLSGSGCYNGGWSGYWGQNAYMDEHIPYYSLHPPVYYSYPVSRPYGWSPFSCSSCAIGAVYGTSTFVTTRSVSRPAIISNSFVESSPVITETNHRMASRPKPARIVNPYVKSENSSPPGGQENAAKTVYPATLANLAK